MHHPRLAFLAAILCCLAASPVARADAAADLAVCEAGFAVRPNDEASSVCFFDIGQKQGLWTEATAAMEALLARDPDNPWVHLYLGHLKWREIDAAGRLYRQASRLFARGSKTRGEYLALASLHRILISRGELDEAERTVERAVAVAKRSGDPDLVARGQILQAKHLQLTGQDLARAYLLLRRAEAALFPGDDDDYPAQRDCLNSLGNVAVDLGRTAVGRAYYGRLAELAAGQGDRFAEALARLGIARALVEENAEMPHPEAREEILVAARRALDAAEAAGHVEVVAKSSLLLGQLSENPAAARGHLKRCREAAVGRDRSYCLDALARLLAPTDAGVAQTLIDEAIDISRQAEDPWASAFAWRERMRVAWAAGEPLTRSRHRLVRCARCDRSHA